ncbi:MAG: helix-turn-helix transcriptional regulator [Corynebacteriales bacterium]|nr:helix-turn-helix transcriptional regulator [Mycobacteriales bacterium]
MSLGDRLALARKVAGISQHTLAQRASYSVSMVRAVEQGREPASPAFVAAVASALRIEPQELYGQPLHQLINADGGIQGISELQTLLAEGSFVTALEPLSRAERKADLAAIQRDRRQDQARRALERLPVLLRQLYGALSVASDVEEQERVNRMIARAYGNAAQITYRFGWLSLAISALDRMEWAAHRSAEPLLLAHAAQQRALILQSHGAYDSGLRLVQSSLDRVPVGNTDENSLALIGSAHLRGAIICARMGDAERANDHLKDAYHVGQRIGRESVAYDTNFGPGNVEIHRVAVELECGDPGKAARLGVKLRIPADVVGPRVGRHWQDVARGWAMVGEHGHALKALNQARKFAPQQTRYHPQVHETIRVIAGAQRRESGTVAHFAAWLGLKI